MFSSACPYYLSRATQDKADVVFLPYNYLIDEGSRKAQGIDVRNSIIIFDEAHNLVGATLMTVHLLFFITLTLRLLSGIDMW
jgi:Rad3-related DNA helicase